MNRDLQLKITTLYEKVELEKLSTESLIIWIVGKSQEKELKLSAEEIVLECWLLNPQKHSMRGYPQFPDSSVVIKRIGEMKGKKGLLKGSEMGGYELTDISRVRYFDLRALVENQKVNEKKGINTANRSLSSLEEAPFKRLIKTPAYKKFIENKLEQIVETDFLYFYGINWHSKKSFIQNRLKNVDSIVDSFSQKDSKLLEVKEYLNSKFKSTRQSLINN
ncbi:MAG: hypothetical protein M3R36_12185 [Bacteroidota bacterium]|nr:hypothetical protein [Bacteroidota bacterium]